MDVEEKTEIPLKPLTLAQLLATLSDLDEAAEVSFDPTTVVGDLKDKVDAIYTVMDRLEHETARLGSIAAEFQLAARRVNQNRERLKEYVRFAMRTNGYEKLPGNRWRLQLQNTAPALVCEREATADDAMAMSAFVTRKVEYKWDKNAIKEHLANGGTFAHGRLMEGQTVRFYVNKGNTSEV